MVGVGLLVALAVALWIGIQGLSRPIGRLNAVMDAFARNDLMAEIPGVDRGDEIGAMARTVAVFKTNALEVDRLRADQEAQKQRTAEERRANGRFAGLLEATAGGIVTSVTAQANELQEGGKIDDLDRGGYVASVDQTAAAAEQAMNVTLLPPRPRNCAPGDNFHRVVQSTQLAQETLNEANAADKGMQ